MNAKEPLIGMASQKRRGYFLKFTFGGALVHWVGNVVEGRRSYNAHKAEYSCWVMTALLVFLPALAEGLPSQGLW